VNRHLIVSQCQRGIGMAQAVKHALLISSRINYPTLPEQSSHQNC
jgi:hypothetical protein